MAARIIRRYARISRPSDPAIARTFGATLSAERHKANLSQEELAERADLSRDAVSLLERGKRVPILTTLYALADGLDISVAYLVGTAREKLS